MSLDNTHDLLIGGSPNNIDVVNGFIDDIRINTITNRYGNSFPLPTLPWDKALDNKPARRLALVNNLLYSPVEEVHLTDIEISNTTFSERSSGTVAFLGRLSDGSSVNVTPYRTITQLSGAQYGSLNGSGVVTFGNIRYDLGVITGKILVKYKGILEKEFTVIGLDNIQKDLNLIDALSVAGVSSLVCIDAGDANSAGMSSVNNLAGPPDFDYGADTSLVGPIGQMTNYFANNSGLSGLTPINGTTNSWSDGLHTGVAYSFCCVTNSSGFTLFGTWNNSTSSPNRGVRMRVEGSELRLQNYGRAVAPTQETSLTVFTEAPVISGWTFIACSFTPGGDIFFRRNKAYVKVEGYRRGTTTTNLATPVNVLSGITQSSPNTGAPSGQFNITSEPGNNVSGASNVALFAFMGGATTEAQFDAIYDSIQERFSLP